MKLFETAQIYIHTNVELYLPTSYINNLIFLHVKLTRNLFKQPIFNNNFPIIICNNSRIEDSFSDTSPPSSSVLNTSRELSVMPTASNTYPEDLAALPSRFAQMNTRESRLARETGTVQKQRGKSVGPNLLGSSYSNTSSSFGSRGGSSSSSKLVHSFPISVSSKVSLVVLFWIMHPNT